MIAVSPSDKIKEDTRGILKIGVYARNLNNNPTINVDQADQIIEDTRSVPTVPFCNAVYCT